MGLGESIPYYYPSSAECQRRRRMCAAAELGDLGVGNIGLGWVWGKVVWCDTAAAEVVVLVLRFDVLF